MTNQEINKTNKMKEYYVLFVIVNHDGKLDRRCDIVKAEKGVTEGCILALLRELRWPSVEYIVSYKLIE